MANSITENKIMILRFTFVFFFYFFFFICHSYTNLHLFVWHMKYYGVYSFCFFIYEYIFVGCNTRCIPFSVICFLSRSGMTSDGYHRGYVSFAHFCYIEKMLLRQFQMENLCGRCLESTPNSMCWNRNSLNFMVSKLVRIRY